MAAEKAPERIRSIPSHSDVVVVGSGLGGLLCANELARHGFKVCVLEQHRVAGGYAHSFRRKGYHFDISLHSIGGLAPGCLTHGVLSSLGIYDKLNLQRCDMLLEADYPDFSVSMPNHPGGTLEELCRMFPGERDGLVKLFDFLPKLKRDIIAPSVDPDFDTPVEAQLSTKYLDLTFEDLLREYVSDPKLLAVLGQLWSYLGLPPSLATATFSTCVFCASYIEGAYYMAGGGAALVRAMVERLRELGSECYTRAAVKRIAVEDGTVTGVELESGEFVTTSIVVSNANPYHTFFDLIPGEEVSQIFRYRLKQMTPSLSAYALYLGLDCSPSTIGIPSENYFYNHQLDCREAYNRVMAHDIDHTDWCLTNFENIDTIMSPKNKGIVSLVELTPSGDWFDLDKDAYAEKKDAVVERLIHKYSKRFPELSDHIAVQEFGTPYTMARYSRNYHGAIYGFAQTTQQSNSRRLRNRSPIDGLYITGSWTWAGGGYEGAMMTGVQTALAIQQQVGAPRPADPIRLQEAPETALTTAAPVAGTVRSEELGAKERPIPTEAVSLSDDEHFRFRTKVEVYGDDLNSKGFADVSAFLRYIDRGRVEAIEEICGEDKKSWIKQYVINVYTININCFGTPGFGERLEVLTGIRKTTTHRAAFDQRIFNAKTKELVLDAQVEVLFLNNDMELVPVPDEIPDHQYDASKFKTGNRAMVPFTDETSFPFRSEFRVYYEDTDAQGITYHVSYMRFCERALFELARAVWPEVPGKSWMAKHRVGVTAAELRYLKSSTLGDYLEVRTGLMEITPFRVVFGQRIVQRKTGEVLADVTSVCQFRDKDDNPVPLPPEALDAGMASLPNGRNQGGDL